MKLDSNSLRTKYDLEAAFLDVVKNAEDDKEISISSITFTANVHRNTFYYHFKNMSEIVLWTLHDTIGKCSGDPRDFIIGYFHKNRRLLAFSKKVLGTDEFLNRMRLEIVPVLNDFYGSRLTDNKDLLLESFAESILVAYLLQDDSEKTMGLIFDKIIPAFI